MTKPSFRGSVKIIPAASRLLAIFFAFLMMTGCSKSQFDKSLEEGRLGKAKRILTFHPSLAKEIDEDGRTRLHKASLRNQKEGAGLLLDKGAEINARDDYGYTPLHYAALRNQEEMVGLLLKKEANPNLRNHYGRTPLHLAAERNFRKTAEHLLQYHADPFARDRNGQIPSDLAFERGHLRLSNRLRPLHYAAQTGDVEAIRRWLTQNPELINSQDAAGKTPLHKAFRYSRTEAAGLLIESGADQTIKDLYSRKPADYSPESRSSSTGFEKLDTEAAEAVDAIARESLSRYTLLNLALVRDGRIIYSRAYGNGRLNGDYVWGSVSKPVTAMLVMHLVNRGVISSLDDPIWTYSPRYRNAMPEAYRNTPVTLRHLLLHQSGVPHNNEPTWKGNRLNLKFEPGTRDMYSTPGYGILGHIIEDVTGKSYSDAVRDFIGRPASADSFWAEKHFRAPGARIHSTVEDMARFSLAVLNHRYVPRDRFRDEMIQYLNGPTGMGWGITRLGTEDLTIFHGGSNGRPQAYLMIKLEKGLSVSILARAKRPDIFELGEVAARLMSILEDRETIDPKSKRE